jgi:hypothetical protein
VIQYQGSEQKLLTLAKASQGVPSPGELTMSTFRAIPG